MGAAAADFDSDGELDVFVTNDKAFNFFFQGSVNGRFAETAFDAGVALASNARYISGMGTDFRDIDNDGLPDIVFVALEHGTFPLFRNTSRGDFADVTTLSGLARHARLMSGFGCGIFDFDNDGWKDIFVACGHVQSTVAAGEVLRVDQHSVFRNLGEGRMAPLVAAAGLAAAPPRRHRGAAFGDLNGDGRLDAVVTALGEPAELWLNASPGRQSWVSLVLQGTLSNRDAIGARIKVVTDKGLYYNHVTTAVGCASASAGPLHFGLGSSDRLDLVEITWPSGAVQCLRDIPLRRQHILKEAAGK